MENKKNFVTLLKKVMKPFVSQHNFSFNKPIILVRNRNDTLHIINFDVHAPGFNCDIAIQPLYVPDDTIVLSLGNRVNHFKVKLPGTWGYGDSHQDEQELKEVINLLETNVLPWFDEVGSPEGIVKFLKHEWEAASNLIVGFPPYLRYLYTGFSYMYLGELRIGTIELEHLLNELQDDSRPWVVELKRSAETLISLSTEGEEKVKQQLASYLEYTRGNLKIKA